MSTSVAIKHQRKSAKKLEQKARRFSFPTPQRTMIVMSLVSVMMKYPIYKSLKNP